MFEREFLCALVFIQKPYEYSASSISTAVRVVMCLSALRLCARSVWPSESVCLSGLL